MARFTYSDVMPVAHMIFSLLLFVSVHYVGGVKAERKDFLTPIYYKEKGEAQQSWNDIGETSINDQQQFLNAVEKSGDDSIVESDVIDSMFANAKYKQTKKEEDFLTPIYEKEESWNDIEETSIKTQHAARLFRYAYEPKMKKGFTSIRTKYNSTLSDKTEGNNATLNTSSVPSHKWPCKAFNITELPATVVLNNETDYSDIFARMNTSHGCGLLLFYSPYCEFCTNLAPLYNAVGRSYPSLAVMAVDTLEAMGMAARYGVVGIPSIFFLYSGKAVSRYNRSRTPGDFQKFIKDLSGYTPTLLLNVTAADMNGPIGTTVKESRDYYMIFSVSFLCLYMVSRLFGAYILNALNRLKDSLVSLFTRKQKED